MDDYAISEGREFLKLITEVDPEAIDSKSSAAIHGWLYEMGYYWNGMSWVYATTDERGGEHG